MFGGITDQHDDHDITGASLYLHVQASNLMASTVKFLLLSQRWLLNWVKNKAYF